MIAWSIETALQSGLFDHVCVSTDDSEIAEIAISAGADVPFRRPSELSDDHTGTNAVVAHAISQYGNNGDEPEYVCCIYATAPFLGVEYLEKGLELLLESNKSFAFSVTTFAFPVQRAIRIGKTGINPLFPQWINNRSQDLEEAFHDAGQFYWGRADAFVRGDALFSDASVPVVLPRHLVQDIDTEEDWLRAELMFEVIRKSEPGASTR